MERFLEYHQKFVENPRTLLSLSSFKVCQGSDFDLTLLLTSHYFNPSLLYFRFMPDFTASRISRTLRAVTTMGQSLEFILLATLPHHLLPLCANALPRPFWEPYFHVIAAVAMSSVFIFIIFFAYFDAQKYVVQCTFTAGSATNIKMDNVYTAGTVFDLNAIGLKVR